jgi:hypothetical protein
MIAEGGQHPLNGLISGAMAGNQELRAQCPQGRDRLLQPFFTRVQQVHPAHDRSYL